MTQVAGSFVQRTLNVRHPETFLRSVTEVPRWLFSTPSSGKSASPSVVHSKSGGKAIPPMVSMSANDLLTPCSQQPLDKPAFIDSVRLMKV